ncbi:nucleoside triphosphate pyrophosphohydrolase [Niabella drilacis]|uniref:Nucleoside triphosphate pyrophosphohydrolase n=1 Tax=Niabella drilacis (strain DSM 25811 / CCM 8410 / CCUG 62505 / LMG 26954 / E90) TaxID=1285928 RepID=A0A1G6ZRK4_NIADE|nr:nucleoside triphosphate pyrophosphohydrolase [Niabella drilacis]SDE04475.1 XTP/dITP diphosphohydrolase [Niabella drilacis]
MNQDAFNRLVQVMDELREKCPWDRKQTIHTLRQMTIEETYELGDAILEEDWKGMKEELGDLLLHIVFYAKIAQEQDRFTITEVLTGITEKLIKRHPHIYPPDAAIGGLKEVRTEEDVKKNWEQLKLKEGKTSVLSGVPRSLPAVVKAMRLQEKAGQVGFEWETAPQVWEKVTEETEELREAVETGAPEKMEEELGDLLFSLINYARFLNIDAEAALERTNKKFLHRFTRMEQLAAAAGDQFAALTLEQMDTLWNQVKTEGR